MIVDSMLQKMSLECALLNLRGQKMDTHQQLRVHSLRLDLRHKGLSPVQDGGNIDNLRNM